MATDDGVKLLLLLRNGFQYDFVRFLLLSGCSRLLKQSAAMRRLLWARMMNSSHCARLCCVSSNRCWLQLRPGNDGVATTTLAICAVSVQKDSAVLVERKVQMREMPIKSLRAPVAVERTGGAVM